MALSAYVLLITDWEPSNNSPDALNFSGKTEGTNYVKSRYWKTCNRQIDCDGDIKRYVGDDGYVQKKNKMRFNTISIEASINTETQETYWLNFHDLGKDYSVSTHYLILKKDSSNFKVFPGKDHSAMKYGKGWFKTIERMNYSEDDNNVASSIKFKYHIVW